MSVMLTVYRSSGAFDSLILSEDGQTCLGAVAKDGTRYLADRVVLATGAWSPALVDLEEQCCSKVSGFAEYTTMGCLRDSARPGYMRIYS